MQDDDDNLFRSEMHGVEPLTREPRIRRRARAGEGDPSLARRRTAAVRDPAADGNTLSAEGVEPLDSWYVLSFKRPGVQNGVFRKLRQGRYEADARLDLHRMRIEQARREVYAFVQDCYRYGLRSVIVVHGKGEGREQGSILKGCVDRWLRQLDTVQAFHSAQARHGGTGAVYVLLRKSEDKKRENRERFSKGRTDGD